MASHWAENGDLIADDIRLRPIGWLIRGGPNDGKMVENLDEIDRSVRIGSITPLYIEIGD